MLRIYFPRCLTVTDWELICLLVVAHGNILIVFRLI